MELISVIVPVYKVEAFLDKCVKSIVEQTYTNLEIILVDDGSPDSCGIKCDNWGKRDTRIRVIHKENGGLSDARNVGMQSATGNYIAFVDSDDWIASDMYEILMQAIQTGDCDISICGYTKVYGNEESISSARGGKITIVDNPLAMQALINKKIDPVVWNKLYKRQVVKDILFEVGKYHEDEFWSYQVIGKAKKLAIVDVNAYFYLQRAMSIMGEVYTSKRLDSLEAKSKRLEYLAIHYPKLVIEGKKEFIFSCLFQGQLIIKTQNLKESDELMRKVQQYIKKIKIHKKEIKRGSFRQRFWIRLAMFNFSFTCRIRNMLNIGF